MLFKVYTPNRRIVIGIVKGVEMPMDGLQFAVSMLGGGLAGGCVNTLFNRMFYWRGLRLKFYPTLSDMFSAYRIRMDDENGRYWVTTVGKVPLAQDDNFIRHRMVFISGLIQYTELKEVRVLRKALLQNMMAQTLPDGVPMTTDLMPEFDALTKCVKKLQGKLLLS
jgi:hypothetical protein